MTTFDTDLLDGAAIIRVTGRLDLLAARGLRDEVTRCAEPSRVVVLDLSATDFLDSSGLGAVVGCLKATRQAGGDLRLAHVSEQVGLVLGLTNLDRVLRPYDSVEAALHGPQ